MPLFLCGTYSAPLRNALQHSSAVGAVLLLILAAKLVGLQALRTCVRPCTGPAPPNPYTSEVYGPSSRCFEFDRQHRLHGCFMVSCEGLTYTVTVSNFVSARCVSAKGRVTFAGWNGTILCDPIEDVCSPEGNVMEHPEQQRRSVIATELEAEHGQPAANILLAAYDAERFNPHTEAERGIDEQYFVEERNAGASASAPWSRGLHKEVHEDLGIVAYKGVKTQNLLDALSSGSSFYMEQDVETRPFRLSGTDTSSVPWGIDTLDGVIDGKYVHHYSGRGVVVFVVDTGVDPDHEELRGRVGIGRDFTDDRTKSTMDTQGHGTHCAGTIAGRTVGVAPEARIVPVRVLGRGGKGEAGWILRAITYILEERRLRREPFVVSASLGSSKVDLVNRAFSKLVNAGVTVVVAAGNDNTNAARASPASEPSVICVGATDRQNKAADFSNWGNLIDIWAPGVDIKSAKPGGGLQVMSGTSMACPHVAGAAALLLEIHPSWSQSQVERELIGACNMDVGRLKFSKGRILQTYAEFGQSAPRPCELAFEGHSFVDAVFLTSLMFIFAFIFVCLFGSLCQGCLRCRPFPITCVSFSSCSCFSCPCMEGLFRAKPRGSRASSIQMQAALEYLDPEALSRLKLDLPEDVKACLECISSPNTFANQSEDVFQSLRRSIRRCPEEQLGKLAGKEIVWKFLMLLAEKRPIFRSQIREVVKKLDGNDAWTRALDAQTQKKRRELLG